VQGGEQKSSLFKKKNTRLEGCNTQRRGEARGKKTKGRHILSSRTRCGAEAAAGQRGASISRMRRTLERRFRRLKDGHAGQALLSTASKGKGGISRSKGWGGGNPRQNIKRVGYLLV